MLRNFLFLLSGFVVLVVSNHEALVYQESLKAKKNLEIINRVLSRNFDEIEKVMVSVGQKISQESSDFNPSSIHKIFLHYSENLHNSESLFSWSFFDWVDSKGYQTVNTLLGVRKNPPLITAERNYSDKEDFAVSFSEAAIGNPSKLFIIPLGMRVANKDKSRSGIITSGINVGKLVELVENGIGVRNDFAVIDNRNSKFVFGSGWEGKNHDKVIGMFISKKYDDFYSHSLSMDQAKYPYTILTGYDKKDLWVQAWYRSLLQFIPVLTLVAVLLFQKKRNGR